MTVDFGCSEGVGRLDVAGQDQRGLGLDPPDRWVLHPRADLARAQSAGARVRPQSAGVPAFTVKFSSVQVRPDRCHKTGTGRCCACGGTNAANRITVRVSYDRSWQRRPKGWSEREGGAPPSVVRGRWRHEIVGRQVFAKTDAGRSDIPARSSAVPTCPLVLLAEMPGSGGPGTDIMYPVVWLNVVGFGLNLPHDEFAVVRRAAS